jgi:hypothetical protein
MNTTNHTAPSGEELKPCPFCGGAVELEQANSRGAHRGWGVVCRNTINLGGTCAIEQIPSASREAATERWNRRAAASAQATATPVPTEFVGVEDQIKRGNGAWRPCTGCYDTEDGHPTQRYADSHYLQCALGNGCSECGGLGAVWEDFSGYEEVLSATPPSNDSASAQATGQAVDLVSANPIGLTPAQKEMQREQMLRNVASKTEARFWHTNFINEFGYEPDAETAYVAGKKATPPSTDAREAGGGAVDTSVIARLCVQILECPLNPTISKFARALLRQAGSGK